MRCQTIGYRRLPHQSKLFLQYIEDFSRVASFYPHPPKLPSVLRAARKLEYPAARRKAVVAVLREQNEAFGAGAAARRNLRRLERGAVAIVTGQQVGLFSGPAYAVYKALTAVAMAEELSQAGVRAVPVFWMATEDHDLEEVRSAHWFSRVSATPLSLAGDPAGGRPVGRLSLGPEIQDLVRHATESLEGPDAPRLAAILEAAYQPGETYGSAFGKLFARLFEGEGLILMDPLDEGFHALAAPVYRRAIQDSVFLREKLLARGKELDRAGYAAQVKVTARSTLLFHLADDKRQAIGENHGKFHAGENTFSRDELLRLAEDAPGRLSANVLLRPVVQDFLLPTLASVVGPGEITYFAQAAALYEHLLGRMPVLLPRADFTLVDAKAAGLLKRYGLTVENVWAGKQKVRHRMELRALPEKLDKEFQRSAKQLDGALERLRRPIQKLDATLIGALERARTAAMFHFEKLQRKAGRAQDLRQGVLAAHEEYLEALLYPHKQTQSRLLCCLPFLAKWGPGALRELKRFSSSKRLGRHQILFLS